MATRAVTRKKSPDLLLREEQVHMGRTALALRLEQTRTGAIRVAVRMWAVGMPPGTTAPLLVLPPSSLPRLAQAFDRLAQRAGV